MSAFSMCFLSRCRQRPVSSSGDEGLAFDLLVCSLYWCFRSHEMCEPV